MASGYAKSVMLAIVIVAAGLVIVFSVVIPYFMSTNGSYRSPDSPEVRRIIILGGAGGAGLPEGFRYVKLDEMATNSKESFLDPFGRTMQRFYEDQDAFLGDADSQEHYMLIKLPEWLGGQRNDISAYRAYSALDIESHCRVGYWPNQDRMDIVDPCHSNRYRPWDGLTYSGASSFGLSGGAILFTTDHLALPQMRLGVDKDGYIVAYKPDNQLHGDGVVGEGRRMTNEVLKQSNQELIEAMNENRSNDVAFYLPPEILPDYHLIWLSPSTNYGSDFGYDFAGQASVIAVYRDRDSRELYDYSIAIVPLSNESEFDLPFDVPDSEIASKAQKIFDQAVGQFECYEVQTCTYETRTGNDIAGLYMVAKIQTVVDPTRDDEYRETTYGRVLIWEYRTDGKGSSYLVSIGAINPSMDELLNASKNVIPSR